MALHVYRTKHELTRWLSDAVWGKKSLGFVPTMGALHPGHLSLIQQAKKENGMIVVSIFVNPTQFNNASDLLLYPRAERADIELLSANGCDCVFIPDVQQMYPHHEKGHWDFGLISSTLEGYYRPGHFDGVLTIVKKFFELIRPSCAYFGEKDFQQLIHIQKLVEAENLPVSIRSCSTLRDANGLAMSSRNLRLSADEYVAATHISKVLFEMKDIKNSTSPLELKQWGLKTLGSVPNLRPEYLDIVNPATFQPLEKWSDASRAIALTSVYAGNIRLIDNLMLQA